MKYRTIVADPPWPYAGMSAPWRSSVDAPYDLMSLTDIMALPVDGMAERDAHLYLWAVTPMLAEAYEVLAAWRFRPSTVITWCKNGPGLGGGWRGNTEHLIVGRRGSLPFLGTQKGTWYTAPRRDHSEKPEVFLDLIEQMSPGPRCELFARRQRLGWDTWGNQCFNHVEMPA